MRVFFIALLLVAFFVDNAVAYVGPGLGMGVIGTFLGVVVAVFLAIVGVVWYPFKRLLRKLKGANRQD